MRRFLALLFALGLFVPLAACGGDDDDSSDDASSSASGTEDEDDEAEEEDEDDDEPSGDAADFCEQVEDVAESDFGDDLTFEDPASMALALEVLEDLADSAPEELEDEFDTTIEGFEIIIEALEEAGDDPEAQAEVFTDLEDELAGFDEATSTIDEFTLEECGITVDGQTEGDDSTSGEDSSTTEDTSLDAFADDVEGCEDGDMTTCDVLYGETPSGSEAEAVALECGGEDPGGQHFGDCEATFG